MRSTLALLALGAAASAQQDPLQDRLFKWYSQASSAVASFGAAASDSATAAAAGIPNPVAAAASKVAAGQVQPLTLSNYRNILAPGAATASPGIEDWMVYVTGGNKTCYGFCDHADGEWNKAVTLLTTAKGSPHLASLDCEAETVLCHAWTASPPSVLYMRVPQPRADQSQPATEMHYIDLNRSSCAAPEIAALYTKDDYKNTEAYEGIWHPFDGQLAKAGLLVPWGYFIYYFGLIPSWAFMIGLSILSRSLMSRRMGPDPTPARAGAAPQGGARPART